MMRKLKQVLTAAALAAGIAGGAGPTEVHNAQAGAETSVQQLYTFKYLMIAYRANGAEIHRETISIVTFDQMDAYFKATAYRSEFLTRWGRGELGSRATSTLIEVVP
ncbi:MAG TPA: hypothetical protein VND64_19870 [Pirellulales bacterium]|nr:hypothetical protein [Pirellulales bacterium]